MRPTPASVIAIVCWCYAFYTPARLSKNQKSREIEDATLHVPVRIHARAMGGAQLKNPQNRIEKVGRAAVEAAGGKFIGGWLCMGEYDAVLIADLPDIESMAGIASRLPRAARSKRLRQPH
jgi:uncharacterized protein with GYD domain